MMSALVEAFKDFRNTGMSISQKPVRADKFVVLHASKLFASCNESR